MKIAILGTRGIPNFYGGFEQFAQYLSLGLRQKGYDVTVYNSHSHPYKHSQWNGVKIVHCYDPENKLGTVGQFVYDLNCIIDSRRRNYDVILQLGYTSSSIWGRLLPRKKSVVTTNMDGLEWKRTKYSKKVQKFLLYAEKLAITTSDYLISDSIGIQKYLKDKYNKESTYIPYGANIFDGSNEIFLKEQQLSPYQYNLLIARLEPENSIEIILDGAASANKKWPFLVIGGNKSKYGNYLKEKFSKNSNIKFIGGIYDIDKLNNLRFYSNVYFHGHTVGGTNPSLLEAMSSHALICAHNNIFNRSILNEDALYFENANEVSSVIDRVNKNEQANKEKIERNIEKIRKFYSWPTIIEQYIRHFNEIT